MNRQAELTCLVDLDGTIIEYNMDVVLGLCDPKPLPGCLEKMLEWRAKGYNIIITTGRDASRLEQTKAQLDKVGIPYDAVLIGIGGAPRLLINDTKPDGRITAKAYSLDRNRGFGDIPE